MHLFISYRHIREDRPVIEEIVEVLRHAKYIVHIDTEIKAGDIWKDRLLEWIKQCEIFVFLITPEAIESEMCKWEYSKAIELGKKMFPILLRETSIPASFEGLREIHWYDLSEGLTATKAIRLVNDLKDVPSQISREKAPVVSAVPPISDELEMENGLDFSGTTLGEDDSSIDEMIAWFFENYEDPVHGVPYESAEGGYQYYNGGPYDARVVLEEQFPDALDEHLDAAASKIETQGWEWVEKGSY